LKKKNGRSEKIRLHYSGRAEGKKEEGVISRFGKNSILLRG